MLDLMVRSSTALRGPDPLAREDMAHLGARKVQGVQRLGGCKRRHIAHFVPLRSSVCKYCRIAPPADESLTRTCAVLLLRANCWHVGRVYVCVCVCV
jgi:hypothetical protein